MEIDFSKIEVSPLVEYTGEDDTYRIGTQYTNENGDVVAFSPVPEKYKSRKMELYGEWDDPSVKEKWEEDIYEFISRNNEDFQAIDELIERKARGAYEFMLDSYPPETYFAYASVGPDYYERVWYAIKESDWELFSKRNEDETVYYTNNPDDMIRFEEAYSDDLVRTFTHTNDPYISSIVPDDKIQYMVEYIPEVRDWDSFRSEVPKKQQDISGDTGIRKPYFQLNAEKILSSVKDGTAPFLSQEAENEKATVTITPAAVRSADTGRVFRGTNQMLAQISLKEIGSPENEVITYHQSRKWDTFIKKDSLNFTMTSYDAEKKKSTAYRYYPVSAVHDPKKLPQIPEHSPNHDLVITCTESEPEKYLGKYLAATSLGARFETSREIMSAFQKNLETDLEKSFAENRHTRVFELGNKASEICRDTIREVGNRSRSQEPVEQTRAQKRGAQKHGQSRESGYSGYAG